MFTLSPPPALENPCHRPTTGMDEPPEHEIAIPDPTSGEMVRSNIIKTTATMNFNNSIELASLDLLNTELLDPDCEAVLETMDSCVGCVEGVDDQHDYEEKMIEHNLHKKAAVEQHGLSDAEAAMIRLHIMEEERDDTTNKQVNDSPIPDLEDLDILNLCGNDDDLDDAQDTFVIAATTEAMSCADMVDEDLLVPRKDTEVRDGIIVGQDINALTCAICFDEALSGGDVALNRVKFANLPCCGAVRPGSSTSSVLKVCTSCILVLTSPSTVASHRIGRCPRCLDWIKVQIPASAEATTENNTNTNTKSAAVTVEKIDVCGQCLICNQEKEYLVENDQVCDSCFLGRRQPLKYECQQCHHFQNIPHPMYRYQETKDEFGNVTWACQGKCGRFTNWKLVPEEWLRIPLGDAPKSWGTDYITLARNRVKILRADLVENNNNSDSKGPAPQLLLDEDPSQCQIL